MVNPNHSFHLADYSIFAVTIIVSLGIGLYYALSGGKQRTTSEYLVGNRQMMILPVAISLMVSFESSIMMLGTPAEIYVYGLQWLVGNFGFLLANLAAIFVLVPLIHPLRITSAYEYLEMRFKSRAVRILGTIMGMLGYAAYMGIVLFGPAIALEAVTGFPQWASIVAVAGAAVIYTAIGGLKAVIWTDVFQCVVMFAGFFAVLIKGTMQIGGIGKTWTIAAEKGRVNFFNFDPDPTVRHTFWNLFVGSLIRGSGLIFNQSSVQRISSTPTVSAATKVMLFTAPAFFLSLTLACIEGVIAYAYYDTIGCDPLASGQIKNPNQIIPYMVMEIFDGLPGMPGLFMASLFSASLSTLSSGLSSLSALFWADLVKPHVKPMSEFRATVIAKLAVVFFGAMAIGIAFGIAQVGGTLIQITGSILSAIGGPLTGLFMLGAFIPFANSKGALVGPISSAIFCFIVAIGQMTTKGAVKNTKLPPAPIDNCPALNATIVTDLVLNATSMYGMGLNSNMSLSDMAVNLTNYVGGSGMAMSTTVGSMAVSGMLATTAATVGKSVPEPTGIRRLFMLSYQWFGSVGIVWTLVVGSIVSVLTGKTKPGEVESRFLIPVFDKFLWWALPKSVLKWLRCGVDYSEVSGERLQDHWSFGSTFKKPTMNGDSSEYTKVASIYDYEIVIDESKLGDGKPTIDDGITPTDDGKTHLADGQMHLKSNSAGHVVENSIAESGPHIHKSFDDLIVPKFQLADQEFELIDLRSNNQSKRRSHDTHIVIDRTVNSVIKLRTKSIEIDVPANKVPSTEGGPSAPDDDNKSAEVPQNTEPGRATNEDSRSEYDNDEGFNSKESSQNAGKDNDNGSEVVITQVVDDGDMDKHGDHTANSDESVETQGLDNVQTVDLDETDEQSRTYGIAVVVNGKDQNKDQ